MALNANPVVIDWTQNHKLMFWREKQREGLSDYLAGVSDGSNIIFVSSCSIFYDLVFGNSLDNVVTWIRDFMTQPTENKPIYR